MYSKKGCASGKAASAAMIEKKDCKVLKCAAMKKVDYCGDCKMFTKCKKIIGRPYAQMFVDMQAKPMAYAVNIALLQGWIIINGRMALLLKEGAGAILVIFERCINLQFCHDLLVDSINIII